MSETLTLSPGVDGLAWVLGGGIRAFSRRVDLKPSGVVLVRGGPGVGKSALAARIALSVAQQLASDVLVGCVEVLTAEAVQQLRGFEWATNGADVRSLRDATTEVVAARPGGEAGIVPPSAAVTS